MRQGIHCAESASAMAEVKGLEPCLLDYRQAAEYLNIGKSTLYALVSEQQLTCVRFGAGKTKRGLTPASRSWRNACSESLYFSRGLVARRRRKRSTQITTKGMRFSGTSRL